ncbi:suppressor APC domain-containing protein 2 [Planococcus citri]|uniref:suppressor APC domain-containing protein 2 n=1 Tax=Planococcus citri TaxID=170843 RepID=UPI0031F79202
MISSPPATNAKSNTLDGLPKPFLHVLKTLFDILDDEGTGLVKFSDIEARWQENSVAELPKGVIESLRKVTPPNGLLSFERYCAGLKICLLRNQMETRNKNDDLNDDCQKHLSQRPPSAPILDSFENKNSCNEKQWSKNSASAAQFGNTMRQNQHRTSSMPHLPPDLNKEESKENFASKRSNGVLLGPPKPPRTNVTAACFPHRNKPEDGNKIDKNEIRVALQNWQMGFYDDKHSTSSYRTMSSTRSVADGTSDYSDSQSHKKCNTRRREPRRHTLQNGVDCNMFKKMKQIESEKEVLLEGLQAVETAREWYRKQIAIVQDKMKYICRMGSHDQYSEAQQERIELLRARIFEVNRHLATLGGYSNDNNKSNSEDRDGLPLHMNLAVHSSSHLNNAQVLSQLKRQNHVLSREVGHKTEKINTLEREKASLLRELYQMRRKSDQPIGKTQPVQDNLPVAPAAYI